MLVDANILLCAVDAASPFHERASTWLTSQLNGPRRMGFPWQSLVAFIRISTHERASATRSPRNKPQALSRTGWSPKCPGSHVRARDMGGS